MGFVSSFDKKLNTRMQSEVKQEVGKFSVLCFAHLTNPELISLEVALAASLPCNRLQVTSPPWR